ncbi:L-threonylcarbamoyladenylate synthase [Spongisporangium articulatum]|uniref:L-threonylcarbamoyladenylate synthase n=1 Tax=Spongisporangium articulatum TaxID=3362603 RepID=A0ABW8ATK7_9ACTN
MSQGVQPADWSSADEVLTAGGVALVPTDTVYGLAVRPDRDDAIDKLFAMKGRPRNVNLPIMVDSIAAIEGLGAVVDRHAARLLSSHLVPGSLTVALGVHPEKLPPWLAGRDEIAVRIPAHDGMLALLGRVGPLLVTSANAHAHATQDEVPKILADLLAPPDLVIDSGPLGRVASTLVNCNLAQPAVERVGVVPTSEIEEVLGVHV